MSRTRQVIQMSRAHVTHKCMLHRHSFTFVSRTRQVIEIFWAQVTYRRLLNRRVIAICVTNSTSNSNITSSHADACFIATHSYVWHKLDKASEHHTLKLMYNTHVAPSHNNYNTHVASSLLIHVCVTNSTGHPHFTSSYHIQAPAQSQSHCNACHELDTRHSNITISCHTQTPAPPQIHLYLHHRFIYTCVTNWTSHLNIMSLYHTQAPDPSQSFLLLCASRTLRVI